MDRISDSTLLLAGRHPGNRNKLHIWNISSDSIVASFFEPHSPSLLQSAEAVVSITSASVMEDSVFAVFGLQDSVFVFDKTGVLGRSIQFASQHFRTIQSPRPQESEAVFCVG